jgi:iron complex outermembrane receptor protein
MWYRGEKLVRYAMQAVRFGAALSVGVCLQAAEGPVAADEGPFFQAMPVVEAASLHTQTLEDAPANVTVISREEIHRQGYRTLAEALSNVRGFYNVFDGAYNYLGSRGLDVPGDYTTRILVMVNGHYMPDNVYNMAGYIGQDFGIDMDLVQRIEVIRGPSSALYGSNGIFATINIVTISPVDHPTARATTEIGSYGEKKIQLSSSMYLGRGANMLLSGSIFHDAGRSVDFGRIGGGPELGVADGVERQRGYHVFAHAVWHNWSFMALANRRDELIPHGYFGTSFNSRGTQAEDGRSFVEAAYSRPLGRNHEINWRFYYDRYRYWGRYDYDGEDATYRYDDLALGHWVGTRLTYGIQTSSWGTLTFGGEANIDLQALQNNALVSPYEETYLDTDNPDRSYGLFLQQELRLSPKWTTYLGARLDDSGSHDPFVSPRLALLYKQSPRTTYKLLYGRSFRNPNAYEEFYDLEGDYRANPNLKPERAQTVEISADHRFSERVRGEATVYRYWLGDLIQNVLDEQGVFQFHNNARVRALGAEFELSGRPLPWLETAGAFTVGRVSSEDFVLALVNSPRSTAQFRFSLPLATRKVILAGAYRYLSSRRTVSGGRVDSVPLFDLTVSTRRLHPSFDVVLGLRNAFDKTYFDPVAEEHVVDRFQRRGRTAFVKIIWGHGE